MATYVCSDFHGLKEHYDEMIAQINAEDQLYVIGDVIDRGRYGITILLDLLSRPNVTMMLGNHEYMMLRYYQAKYGMLPKGEDKYAAITNWMFNHCTPTMREFEALSDDKQQNILETIARMPLAICNLQVQDTCYYLVHGTPSTILTKGTLDLLSIQDIGLIAEDLLWKRIDPKQQYFQDRCVITGHTPTLFFQKNKPYEIWIQGEDIQTTHLMDIDCGCAAQDENSCIALLRLEDRLVRYY